MSEVCSGLWVSSTVAVMRRLDARTRCPWSPGRREWLWGWLKRWLSVAKAPWLSHRWAKHVTKSQRETPWNTMKYHQIPSIDAFESFESFECPWSLSMLRTFFFMIRIAQLTAGWSPQDSHPIHRSLNRSPVHSVGTWCLGRFFEARGSHVNPAVMLLPWFIYG